MARLSLLLMLVAVVAVSAQKRCCTPDQFMAGVGSTIGESDPGPTALYSNSYGAYDFTNKRFGLNVTIAFLNDTSISYRLIQKFSTAGNFQWIIYDQYKLCIKQPVTAPAFQNCVPENATFYDTMSIGGPSGLMVDVWSYEMSTPKDPVDGRVSATVIPKNCYPVGNSFVGVRYQGSESVPMVTTSGVFNMTEGIPNPDAWFTLPSYCQQEVNEIPHRHARSIQTVHDYFVPLVGF
ncbi:development-specific protein LVN1.2-like [Diadema antillarum]|uniref:development-specific protein LVN1.2-like n=1 Tax=Diadema antillarum TaxID=105358 RepID=UPI003A86CA1E